MVGIPKLKPSTDLVSKAGIPRDDENKSNQPPIYQDKSAGNTDLQAPPNGYWCHPGCRLDLLFYNKSAGEVTFLVKSIVQCTDEIDHEI